MPLVPPSWLSAALAKLLSSRPPLRAPLFSAELRGASLALLAARPLTTGEDVAVIPRRWLEVLLWEVDLKLR